VEVIGQRTLWKGKFIKSTLISYRDCNGKVRQWEAVSRLNYNGVVVIIPITKENRLILIRQFRPALNNYVIEFPAGLIDPGEDAELAGRRELIEETGHAAENFELCTEGVISTGINSERWNILIAFNIKEVTDDVLRTHPPDDNEDIEVIKVSIDNIYSELERYSREGDDIDLRIYGLLELAKKKLAIT
jgi:ADP-ribose pyrophosphatase